MFRGVFGRPSNITVCKYICEIQVSSRVNEDPVLPSFSVFISDDFGLKNKTSLLYFHLTQKKTHLVEQYASKISSKISNKNNF
jgi:hypothetical protein